jgi:hypothetical protein
MTHESPNVIVNDAHEYELNAVQELNRSTIAEEFEINEDRAVMKLKNGTVEEYDLKNKEQRKNFEKKYGKIIEVSPVTGSAGKPVTVIDALGERAVLAPSKEREPGVLFLNDEGHLIGGETEILFTITRKTTGQQLDELVTKMKERGIQLKFTNVNFNDGTLTHVEGNLKLKDSNSHFSATDFHKMIISSVKDGDHIYLKIDIVERRETS